MTRLVPKIALLQVEPLQVGHDYYFPTLTEHICNIEYRISDQGSVERFIVIKSTGELYNVDGTIKHIPTGLIYGTLVTPHNHKLLTEYKYLGLEPPFEEVIKEHLATAQTLVENSTLNYEISTSMLVHWNSFLATRAITWLRSSTFADKKQLIRDIERRTYSRDCDKNLWLYNCQYDIPLVILYCLEYDKVFTPRVLSLLADYIGLCKETNVLDKSYPQGILLYLETTYRENVELVSKKIESEGQMDISVFAKLRNYLSVAQDY